MSNVMSAAQRAVCRRLGWRWLAAAISLAIVVIASATLYRVFHEIDVARVIDALKTSGPAKPPPVVPVCCGRLSYVDLLRCICVAGDRTRVTCPIGLPPLQASRATRSGTISARRSSRRALSATASTPRWGLSVGEIARIAFITGLTYWLGNAFVLGCGIALAPGAASAINHLPAPINRLIGLAALTAINCYMLWLLPRPRSIGRLPWRVALPNPASTLVQIAIGSLDLIFVTLAMYVLLPAQPAIDFFDLLVVFVTAMLIGVVSYVPGSLGVIEAAMFLSLPQFPREDLLASLLTFRLLYFVVPLILASLLFGLREARLVVAGLARSRKLTRLVSARK